VATLGHMWYRSRSPGHESPPESFIESSVKRWSQAHPLQIILAPECGLVVWWFPSFSPSSVIHAAGGHRRRTSEKASARMTEHISSFSTDFRIGSLPCVCVCKTAGRRCWPNCHGAGRNGPLRRQTFIQCAFVLETNVRIRNMEGSR